MRDMMDALLFVGFVWALASYLGLRRKIGDENADIAWLRAQLRDSERNSISALQKLRDVQAAELQAARVDLKRFRHRAIIESRYRREAEGTAKSLLAIIERHHAPQPVVMLRPDGTMTPFRPAREDDEEDDTPSIRANDKIEAEKRRAEAAMAQGRPQRDIPDDYVPRPRADNDGLGVDRPIRFEMADGSEFGDEDDGE